MVFIVNLLFIVNSCRIQHHLAIYYRTRSPSKEDPWMTPGEHFLFSNREQNSKVDSEVSGFVSANGLCMLKSPARLILTFFLTFCGYKVSNWPALADHERSYSFIYLLLTQIFSLFCICVVINKCHSNWGSSEVTNVRRNRWAASGVWGGSLSASWPAEEDAAGCKKKSETNVLRFL